MLAALLWYSSRHRGVVTSPAASPRSGGIDRLEPTVILCLYGRPDGLVVASNTPCAGVVVSNLRTELYFSKTDTNCRRERLLQRGQARYDEGRRGKKALSSRDQQAKARTVVRSGEKRLYDVTTPDMSYDFEGAGQKARRKQMGQKNKSMHNPSSNISL